MRSPRWLRRGGAVLACLGMLLPARSVMAEAPPAASRTAVAIGDVSLHEGGVLLGQVANAAGTRLVGQQVVIQQGDREVAVTRTDGQGQFAVRGLRGGTYQLSSGPASGVYRVWATGTAPPSANSGVLLVADDLLVRGELPALKYWLVNPYVMAGLIAAAVAIPVAINNSRDRSSS